MIRVQGDLDGVPYEVALTGDPVRPVVGSERVAALVRMRVGRRVQNGPESSVVVDPGDPASVQALLQEEGHATTVLGAPAGAPRKLNALA